jgi:hypothetical protein
VSGRQLAQRWDEDRTCMADNSAAVLPASPCLRAAFQSPNSVSPWEKNTGLAAVRL